MAAPSLPWFYQHLALLSLSLYEKKNVFTAYLIRGGVVVKTLRRSFLVSLGPFGLVAVRFQGLPSEARSKIVRENQTCTELRSTISRHILPPISLKLLQIFCSFSSFNFQGNLSQEISHTFLHTSGPQVPQP